jgi:DNA-binding IclR family transcriptional regulator
MDFIGHNANTTSIGQGIMTKANKQEHDERYMVPAVEQAMRVMFHMAATGASHLSLTEIYTQVGIHKSKAFSILHTLQKYGVVQRNTGGNGYSLGPGIITLSRKVLDNASVIKVAEPFLKDLSKKASGTATLGLIAENSVFVVAKHEVERDIGVTIRVGHRFPLTMGSNGKAIAAFLPADDLNNLLSREKLYFHGKPEKLDRERLAKELAQARRDGFAIDHGEIKPGLHTVAAPVLGIGEIPIGYIAVIGLFSAKATRQLGVAVAEAGKVISRQLGALVP